MCGLGANGVLGILLDHVGARLWDHLVDVLFARTGHASADDINERQHARGRTGDNRIDEVLKVLPSRAAGIDAGCHAVGQALLVGV